MADRVSKTFMNSNKNLYLRILEVAESEIEIRFPKFKMVDLIWRYTKFLDASKKFVPEGF